MNDSDKYELLSAYLDRELSATEQAEVEQQLESDPQARQVLEQLAQLGEMLRDLPQQRVRSSFAADCMSRIREQPAHGANTSDLDPAGQPASVDTNSVNSNGVDEPHTHVTLPVREEVRATGGRFRNPWIWGTVAAAAALLVLAYPLGLLNLNNDIEGTGVVEAENQPSEDPVSPGPETDSPPQLVETPRTNIPDDPMPAPEVPDPSVPAPETVVEVTPTPNTPRPTVPTPSVPNITAPFVANDFTAEDEKILRLLESLVLVRIECTPAAAKSYEFDKILKKNKIKVAEKATPKRPANAAPPATEVYYIEASAEQAEAVLNEVNTRNTEFTSMAMRTETLQTKNMLNADQGKQPQVPGEVPDNDPAAPKPVPEGLKQGRGSFAEKFHVQTKEELEAMRKRPGQAPSASDVLPFLQGQSDLDTILGNSPVEAEHLVRMLVVLETVEAKKVE